MNDDNPREVALHFGIATALSLSLIAAPFVPEVILAYAGYRFLRHFTYGWRTWRARGACRTISAAVATATRLRAGVVTPLGRSAWRRPARCGCGARTWFRGWPSKGTIAIPGSGDRQPRVRGCMNRMGAIIVEAIPKPVARSKSALSDETPLKKPGMLTRQISEIAQPFGRDTEICSIDLDAGPQPPLRIAASTLTARDRGNAAWTRG